MLLYGKTPYIRGKHGQWNRDYKVVFSGNACRAHLMTLFFNSPSNVTIFRKGSYPCSDLGEFETGLFGRDLTCKERNTILPVGPGGWTLQNWEGETSFHRSIEITQNATRHQSGSNKMADARLAARVRGKIVDKCLVMRLIFAFIKEFCF